MVEKLKPRILIISQYFWPENFRINECAKWLQEAGYSVTVLTGVPNYPSGVIYEEFKTNRRSYDFFGKIQVFRLPVLTRGRSRVQLLLNYITFAVASSTWAILGRKRHHFDVVFVFAPSPIFVVLPGIVLKYFTDSKLVLWVLDLWPETLASLKVITNAKVLQGLTWMVSKFYQKCDVIYAQNSSAAALIGKKILNKPDVKLSVLESWCDESFELHVVKKKDTAKVTKKFVVTFAGNIGIAQDIDTIIKAIEVLKNLNELHFNVAGTGSQINKFKVELTKKRISEKVTFLGQIPGNEIPKLFAQSDVLLITLLSSAAFDATIPAKLQSYMFAGKTVIGAINGVAADIIRDANCGFCGPSGDYLQLAKNIESAAWLKKDELLQLGKNGRSYYDDHFSLSASMLKLEKDLASLFSGEKPISKGRISKLPASYDINRPK